MTYHVDGEPVVGSNAHSRADASGCAASGGLKIHQLTNYQFLQDVSLTTQASRIAGDLRGSIDRLVERPRVVAVLVDVDDADRPAVSPRPSAKFAMFTRWRPRIVPTSPMTPG